MSIKISSDSTCDLSARLLEKYEINIVPLYVMKGTTSFRDGIDIVPTDIFAYTDTTGKLCSTAAVSVYDYEETFRALSAAYDEVIHVTISSEFSSCYQNACTAAQQFSNVYVVDSCNLSTGQGHIVLEGAKMAQQGEKSAAEICAVLNELTPKVEASFLLDRLDYMVKGGRCSAVAALGANLLKLKPCIEVVDGKMRVGKKYRGSYNKCIHDYVSERLLNRDDIRDGLIFITHAAAESEMVDIAHATIEETAHFDQIEETSAGCTVTSHCGPHTLGVLFIRK